VTRVRLGAVTVLVIAALVAGIGLLGGSGREPSGIAAAAASALSGSAEPASSVAATPDDPTRAAETPVVQATDSPTPEPSATPRPPEPTPAPTATPDPKPPVDGGTLGTTRAHALQRRLDAWRAKHLVPGVSVAMLWDDGRSWLGVSGDADVADGRPVTPDTGFALASISKTFTAAVVLELVDEGELQLDDRVAHLLPAFDIDRRVTVRMLLDHTSDINDFFFNPRIDHALQSRPGATWTARRTYRYVPPGRIRPGKVWSYSNTNYLLLGELVKAVTGRPLAKEVRARLLDPLDLETAWYQTVEKPRTELTTGYRLVPLAGGGARAVPVARASDVMPFRSVVTAAGGAGSIAATAKDTARWMQAFAGGEVLSPAMQTAMLGDATYTRALHARIPYGLGIQIVTMGGRPALGHSGRYLGYRNVVRYLPADGVTIAVLTNQGVVDPAVVAASLLKVALR
jgi:CubicO group peptidase (beta-lactamase class C family)